MSIQQLYEQQILPLPATQRLRLASWILNDITQPSSNQTPMDVSDEWSEEDFQDFAHATLDRLTEIEWEQADGKIAGG
jgi:hypothetical protein